MNGDLSLAPIPAWDDGVLSPVDKIAVHRRGLRHMAVSVFVTDGQDILIQRRAMRKYHTPGLWANSCCTHPHWDEAPEVCAQRRLSEELGITGLALAHAGQVEYRADVGNAMIEHEVVDIYVAASGRDLALRLDPAEVMDARWISLGDLRHEIAARPEAFTPWLKIYLDLHCETIFGAEISQ
ncbi:MAG: isopentenyl-diphosphate Delta-isomerase [Albidovulum sp.]